MGREPSPKVRDRALDLRWRFTNRDLIELLLEQCGPTTVRRSDALEAILASAIAASQTDRPWISYSRDKNWYAHAGGYLPVGLGYRLIVDAVDRLEELELLKHDRKRPSSHNRYQSRFRLLKPLPQTAHLLHLRHRNSIILREGDKQPIDYRETEPTRRLRRELDELNEAASCVLITFPNDVIQGGEPWYWSGTAMHRVFTHDFDLHGRFYCDAQNIPRRVRCSALISGEPAGEVDFSAMHIRLAAARRGYGFGDYDPYLLGGFKRADVKLATNIALNARTARSACLAIANELGRGFGVQAYACKLLDAVKAAHPLLTNDFGSGAGLGLMASEALIAQEILRTMMRLGVPCLPIHDSFVVPRPKVDLLVDEMVRVFTEQTGQRPSLKKIF
jgi:hypothetical protein